MFSILFIFTSISLFSTTPDEQEAIASKIVVLEENIAADTELKEAWIALNKIEKSEKNNIEKVMELLKLRSKLRMRLVTAEEDYLFHLYAAAFKIESQIKYILGKITKDDLRKRDAYIIKNTICPYTKDYKLEDEASVRNVFEELVFKKPTV